MIISLMLLKTLRIWYFHLMVLGFDWSLASSNSLFIVAVWEFQTFPTSVSQSQFLTSQSILSPKKNIATKSNTSKGQWKSWVFPSLEQSCSKPQELWVGQSTQVTTKIQLVSPHHSQGVTFACGQDGILESIHQNSPWLWLQPLFCSL